MLMWLTFGAEYFTQVNMCLCGSKVL